MKNMRLTLLTTMAALLGSTLVWADDAATKSATDTMAHPVEAYHEHEVNADAKDSQIYAQSKAEAKARMDQAKADYEKSIQTNGADSDVTKQAKKRLAEARKEYKKLAMKASKANKELKEDTQELNKDKGVQ